MRRFAVLTVCLLAFVPAIDSALAADGKGAVSRSWISTTSGGTSAGSFSAAKVKRLYANFVWKTPATAGQVLRIEWHDPAGALRAVWKDKTIKDDKRGTRLFAWIGSGLVKGTLGSWSAVLTVGGTQISKHKFRIVA
jgi:hypothetical protein